MSGNYRYNAHSFTNNGPATCITFMARNSCTNSSLFAAAYAGPFNPADLCANYLADAGDSDPLSMMSFPIGSNAVFTIVVNEVTPGAGCSNYALELHGLPCPPPVLNIARATAGNVRLSWKLSGGDGYLVQCATALANGGQTPFVTLSNGPVAVGNTFTVTNNASGPQQFYRLVK